MKNKRFFWAMLFVGFLWINQISCGGGGGGGGGSTSNSGGNTNIFTTSQNNIVIDSESSNLTFEGADLQVVSKQVIAEFKEGATSNDYKSLKSYLESNGYSIIGQIPNLMMVQIKVQSNDKIVPLITELKKLLFMVVIN